MCVLGGGVGRREIKHAWHEGKVYLANVAVLLWWQLERVKAIPRVNNSEINRNGHTHTLTHFCSSRLYRATYFYWTQRGLASVPAAGFCIISLHSVSDTSHVAFIQLYQLMLDLRETPF
jgi:hypothetical protein